LGGLGQLNLAHGKVFIHKASASLVFLRAQGIYFGHLGHKVGVKVEEMVEEMGRGELLHILLPKDPLESFEGGQ
jgi:hypothetical protein